MNKKIRKKYEQNSSTRIITLNTEKQKPPKPNLKKNYIENRNITNPNTRREMLTEDNKINIELVKKIKSDTNTSLSSLRNEN